MSTHRFSKGGGGSPRFIHEIRGAPIKIESPLIERFRTVSSFSGAVCFFLLIFSKKET